MPAPAAWTSDQLAIACGPRLVLGPPATPLRVAGSQDGRGHTTYGPGQGIVITGGTAQGVQAGQEFYVRRVARPDAWPAGPFRAVPIHTSGWIRITAVQDEMAIAEVVHACDGMSLGDHLEPFVPPQMPAPTGDLRPDYGTVGRVVMGQAGRRSAGAGEMMLIDRGTRGGVVAGQRLTVFRAHYGPGGPVTNVADAIAVEPAPEVTMIRITRGRDAVHAGDLVALHPVRP